MDAIRKKRWMDSKVKQRTEKRSKVCKNVVNIPKKSEQDNITGVQSVEAKVDEPSNNSIFQQGKGALFWVLCGGCRCAHTSTIEDVIFFFSSIFT
jgi:hypothetical protein